MFGQVLSGEATPAQIAGFAVALRAKGESVAEMTGFVRSMVAHAVPLDLPAGIDLVDTCGTGGDRLREHQRLDHRLAGGGGVGGQGVQARWPGLVVGGRGRRRAGGVGCGGRPRTDGGGPVHR